MLTKFCNDWLFSLILPMQDRATSEQQGTYLYMMKKNLVGGYFSKKSHKAA